MLFPSASSYIDDVIQYLLLALIAAIGMGLAYEIYRRRAQKKTLSTEIKPVTFTRVITSFMVLLVGMLITIGLSRNYLNYLSRRIDTGAIVAVRIARLADENSPPPVPEIELTDQNKLLSGFAGLPYAKRYWRDHERFSDGYRLQVRLEGETSFGEHTIDVFRKSIPANRRVVIVTMPGVGQFESPAFHDWIRANVDPLF
jgi:hypothetical protein